MDSMKDVKEAKKYQAWIGVGVLTLFIISSVIINNGVFAANQALFSYGYYGGTYGYKTTTTSSDATPNSSGTITAAVSNTSADLTWSAPTTTTLATLIANGGGSISSYNIYYNTSSISTCASGSGGSSTTSTTAAVTISGLTSGTAYNVVVCAVDNNNNEGNPKTGSFTTASAAGSSGGGAGGGSAGTSIFSSPSSTTTSTSKGSTTSTTVTSVSVVSDADALVSALGLTRNTAAEATNAKKVASSVAQFKATLTAEQKVIATNFVTYGTSSATIALGSGERLALVRDQLETLGRLSLTALEQLSTGQKPTERNLVKEKSQVALALKVFIKLTGHKPDFKKSNEDLAWNTLQYRIRFPRNLNKEKTGILKFKAVEKRNPATPFDWSEVRAWGYQLGAK